MNQSCSLFVSSGVDFSAMNFSIIVFGIWHWIDCHFQCMQTVQQQQMATSINVKCPLNMSKNGTTNSIECQVNRAHRIKHIQFVYACSWHRCEYWMRSIMNIVVIGFSVLCVMKWLLCVLWFKKPNENMTELEQINYFFLIIFFFGSFWATSLCGPFEMPLNNFLIIKLPLPFSFSMPFRHLLLTAVAEADIR